MEIHQDENKIYNFFNKKIIQNIKVLMYMKTIAKLKNDNTAFTPNFALLPVPIDKEKFKQAENNTRYFTSLIEVMSRDNEFLYKSLTNLTEFDPFVKGLISISKRANDYKHENKQTLHLGIYRNDYMMCERSKKLKQVEYNTIAASISLMADGSRSIYEEFSDLYPEIYSKYKNRIIEVNKGLDGITKALEIGHFAFIDQRNVRLNSNKNLKSDIHSYAIAVVVTDDETNLFETITIEMELWKRSKIKTIRITIREFYESYKTDNDNNIIIDNNIISIFYFRAGYCIEHFEVKNKEDNKIIGWEAREIMELSSAIKVPDINSLLCTLKKFQHVLYDKNVLLDFMSKISYLNNDIKKIIDDIHSNFVEIIDFNEIDNIKKENVLKMLIDKSEDYLIKPMKEGGGNNYNYDEVKQIASSKDYDTLNKSIIMERIYPPSSVNYVLKSDNKIYKENVITEIGIYSYFLSDIKDNKIYEIHNKTFGALFRTKFIKEAEGGVSFGSAYANYGYYVCDYLK